MLEGEVELAAGEETHRLTAGDCLTMRPDLPTAFRNPTDRPARHLVALARSAAGPSTIPSTVGRS
ncbi:MAG: hypothetical protein AVDCRST_MAG28-696 [uncultured Rubrobacteraceae bacterium]|uniref:Cupin type-2 domain-containing protein n=1 Tax=uncultured Rubrobacteraceae bacterium TaxID=349277 RepID=A0A6J4QL28_9ACTN|nr:MAG: hypothetical protein AVDCRST_MAG28-696 [uncultured Rubrobacteraceae bacterium]